MPHTPPGICIVCQRRIPKRVTEYQFSHADVNAPRSKADCEALTNQKVINVRYWGEGTSAGRHVSSFSTWDGETYRSPYFCTDACARLQGIASAEEGTRYNWTKRGEG